MSAESGKMLFVAGASIGGLALGISSVLDIVSRDANELLPFMERVGVPAVLLLAALFSIGWVTYKAVTLFSAPVKAWLTAQVDQSRVACDTLPKIERSLSELVSSTGALPGRMDSIDNTLRDHTNKLDRLIDRRIDQ